MDFVTLAMAKQYTDSQRLGYVGEELVECLPTSEIDANRQNNYGYFAARTSFTPPLAIGKRYTVIFDGKTYSHQVCELSGTQPALGNLAHVGGENNGESWSVGLTTAGTANITAETSGFHTIAIYEESEVVHKIDPKFIPAMDSIILNGADGKRYAVTINESGVLVATAIE